MCSKKGDKGRAATDAAMRKADEEKAAAAAEAARVREETAAKQSAAEDDSFKNNMNFATTSARSRLINSLKDRNVVADPFMDRFNTAISDQQALVPNQDKNVGSYFGKDFVDNVINGIDTSERNRITREVNAKYSPTAADSMFSNDANDSFINKILGDQRNEAQVSVDRAKARGNLDDAGYSRAQGRIGELASAGFNTANSLADAKIQGYRGSVNDILNNARTAAGSYKVGDAFNLGDYDAQVASKQAEFGKNLEGDTNAALAGQNFFDIGDILNKGGIAQGAVNPSVIGTPNTPATGSNGVNVNLLQRGAGQGSVF